MPDDRLAWRTSTFTSNGQSCVEVALNDTVTALRDTKHRSSGHLAVPTPHAHMFITALKSGHFQR